MVEVLVNVKNDNKKLATAFVGTDCEDPPPPVANCVYLTEGCP